MQKYCPFSLNNQSGSTFCLKDRCMAWAKGSGYAGHVGDLDITVRSANCLKLANITNVDDLIQHTENELLKIQHFGETSLRDVKQALSIRGLRLSTRVSKSTTFGFCKLIDKENQSC